MKNNLDLGPYRGKNLDPDPYKTYTDPKPWLLGHIRSAHIGTHLFYVDPSPAILLNADENLVLKVP